MGEVGRHADVVTRWNDVVSEPRRLHDFSLDESRGDVTQTLLREVRNLSDHKVSSVNKLIEKPKENVYNEISPLRNCA